MLMCLGDEVPYDEFWSSTAQTSDLSGALMEQINLENIFWYEPKWIFPQFFRSMLKWIKTSLLVNRRTLIFGGFWKKKMHF